MKPGFAYVKWMGECESGNVLLTAVLRVTACGGGSVMVWGGISFAGKTRLVVMNGTMNAQRYRDEIPDPVAIPYVQNMGVGSILQDDNARHTLL